MDFEDGVVGFAAWLSGRNMADIAMFISLINLTVWPRFMSTEVPLGMRLNSWGGSNWENLPKFAS